MTRPMLIGIAGGTGSGKSTFAEGLRVQFPNDITIISYDNYYKPQDDIPLEERVKTNYDCPEALDTELLIEHLRALVDGNTVDMPNYDFCIHTRKKETTSVAPTPIIIVDGILTFCDDDLRNMFDVKIFADADADELWQYFQEVIAWTQRIFPNYRKEMKGLEWGELYNEYHDNSYNAQKMETEIARLMQDEDVTAKKGIYEYLLSGDERHLSIRAFTDNMKREAYERQQGICPICKEHFEINEMEADHITPWSQGGKTIAENCQMLCRDCNRRKSDK